ncbi:bifunctional pirin family protein/GNAT family N-acetyltransferase [Leucobacter komagatae]|uniref:N-acetyltransferase domain-containing protein n=1 Tax=Leucobacter komagatae TaxID=55969 RepID=A0A0D0INS0_9MICO|nr:hypothetical protein SD72_07090 [Leucobacter komagatae]
MSNLESNPTERRCAAGPGEPGHVEVLEPREVPLGGLRGMPVRRTLPQRGRSLIGAWCFLDHYGPDSVADTGGMNVRAHPHTGLQTVSWLFSGTIEHRDSAGNHALVKPGELNLMTAGSGISHSERSTADTTVLHGAQLWVALPERARGIEKRFDHYAPPTVTGEGFTAKVFLGSLLGEVSPVATHTPLVGAELTLAPGASLTLSVDPAHEHGVLVDHGSTTLAAGESLPTELAREELGFAAAGCPTIELAAGPDGARLLVIGGAPLDEELVMWWNFIGGSHEEVAAARDAWQATIADAESGASSQGSRYGLPDGEPEPPLPAPALPTARLLPRSQLPPLPEATPTTPTTPGASPAAQRSHPSASAPTTPTEEDPLVEQPSSIRVAHEPGERRYAIYLDDALAGFADYRVTPGGGRAFVHTEIAPEFGGRGLAGTLVAEAIADTHGAGLRIVPYCPFVSAWLKKHPQYEESVDWPNT